MTKATIEMVKYGGILEKEDIEKSIKIRETHFWQLITKKWICDPEIIRDQKAIKIKISKEKIREICENWKLKAMAADAYVESWECIQRGKEEDYPLESTCVKPRFMLVNQGELLMSSAMEVIKGMYRKLFGWGPEDGLKIELNFANQKAWDWVDRWLKAFKGRVELDEMDPEIEQMLLEAENNDILSKAKDALNNDPYFDGFEYSEFSKVFLNAPRRFETASDLDEESNSKQFYLIGKGDKDLEYEKEQKAQTLIILQEFENQLNLYEQEENEEEKLKIAKLLYGEYVKTLWSTSQEIGLAWSNICQGSDDVKKTMETTMEAKLGAALINYKNKIQVPMMEKHPKEMKQLLVMDPCEEAKLKVWAKKEEKKTDGDDQSEENKISRTG